MITIDELKAKTVSSAGKSKANVTFKFEPELTIEHIVDGLEEYFGQAPLQKVVKLIFETGERRYLKRTDFMSLVTVSNRGIGEHDGGILPGDPKVTFIKLCCPIKGCKEVLWVTSYDENDPPHCDVHKDQPMEPCK